MFETSTPAPPSNKGKSQTCFSVQCLRRFGTTVWVLILEQLSSIVLINVLNQETEKSGREDMEFRRFVAATKGLMNLPAVCVGGFFSLWRPCAS